LLFVTAAVIAACGNTSVVGTGDASLDVAVSCTTGQTACNNVCVDTRTSRDHCGACGTVCPGGQVCVAGACAIACPGAQRACNGACVTVETDRANCGACGNACDAGQVCAMGRCGVDCGPTLARCSTSAGDAGVGDAGTSDFCANTQSDNLHCGACNNACAPGSACVAGRCQVSCAPSTTACAGVCRDLQSVSANCGACGYA
jgi:hypothetical protein